MSLRPRNYTEKPVGQSKIIRYLPEGNETVCGEKEKMERTGRT